jgi:WhiB family transcriptional regulator, redox-sensing transcriptional regulator
VTALMTDWWDRAACRDEDPDLFFPASPARVAKAKQVCAICPVQAACLDWALRYRQDYGVWGGTSEEERRTPGAPVTPRTAVLCASGRHLKDGPGRCPGCSSEWERERGKTRVRDQAAVYARRAARARKEKELVA